MIQNIWAVGRNYADHAKELGNEVPTSPLVFLKAGSCATLAAKEIHLPEWGKDIHHEMELALQFDENLQIDEACIALDLTERTKQAELKAKGSPWTLAKSFKEACPLSSFFPVADLEDLKNLELIFKVNGQVKQQGNTNQMIFTLEKLIDFVRQHFPVMPGDLLLTGTPAGVGPLKSGDTVEAEIVGKITHKWSVK
ncbi:fumarylacetoacetate hydrolase family protein [Bdellovibrio sp. NC01]|uniref:fumarylacetoacetate hydrolase family protein n=1 Tax=Bdellovibrio sp. NC01 TaxID=2220073 RepID=UPI001157327B|nr:fumarylacetoacetate hydrolase family protein [Bdellovibrio sp. NC01]QDK37128.1 FAA hydrolase family protein [Bdellovibrio sp. NC01]